MLKVIELFAGYGSQSLALRNIGIKHVVVGISEIDKYAIQAYNLLRDNSTINFGDITEIDETKLPDCDLLTYSFPCQSVSISGKQEGLSEGSETTSSLLWECRRIIQHKKPKYLLMENVKNLVSKKFKPEFDKWLKELEEMGYNNYWKVLNSKDYGVAQNRERVFCVSILKEFDSGFEFPLKQELKLRLKDILENNVDEKYYISNEITKKFIDKINNKELKEDTICEQRTDEGIRFFKDNICGTLRTIDCCGDKRIIEPKIIKLAQESGNHYGGGLYDKEGISPTLTSSNGGGGTNNIPKILQIGLLDIKGNEQIRRVYDEEGLSPTLNTMQGGNRMPKVLTDLKFIGGIGDKDWANDGKQLSRNYPQGNKVYDSEGIACSQTANGGGIGGKTGLYLENYRIRKLTPRECFRLMGMKDDDIDKLNSISNSQKYKLAGNSIVIHVLEAIFTNLLK